MGEADGGAALAEKMLGALEGKPVAVEVNFLEPFDRTGFILEQDSYWDTRPYLSLFESFCEAIRANWHVTVHDHPDWPLWVVEGRLDSSDE